jgi:hypothetical protein
MKCKSSLSTKITVPPKVYLAVSNKQKAVKDLSGFYRFFYAGVLEFHLTPD